MGVTSGRRQPEPKPPGRHSKLWIKICGICDVQSANEVVRAGADAIGLNFISRSKRYVTTAQASEIANAVRGAVEIVGVVEDLELTQAAELRERLGLDRIQMYDADKLSVGSELPNWAYIAVGIKEPEDVQRLEHRSGTPVLVDACVAGKTGGTGTTFNWQWVVDIAKRKHIVLAGGLTPTNVRDAIELVNPWGVDVASGVEYAGKPGMKDPELVARFIQRAREAADR